MAGKFTNLGEAANDDNIDVEGLVKDKMTETSKEVEKISNLSNKKISEIKIQAENNSDFIDKIIQADSKNIKLAKYLLALNSSYYRHFNALIFNDTSVLEVAIKSDSSVYLIPLFKNTIDLSLNNYKKNKKLANLLISSFVKSGSNVLDVENFISKVGGENKAIISELKSLYQLELKKAGRIYKNDIKKNALNLLNIEDKSILEIILKTDLISKKGDINKSKIKKLEKLITTKIADKKLVQERESLLTFLRETFGLSKEQFKIPGVLAFIESIYNFLNIEIISDKEKESAENSETDLEEDILDVNEESEELLEFCAPDCSLSSAGTDYCIDMYGNDSVKIKQEEFKKFTSTGLENFVRFHKILQEIGLGFLLHSKNKSSFIQLLRNSLDGFEYTSGEGFSDRYIKKTLTVIANLMGIPETMYGEGGKLGKFSDINQAKKAFNNVNGTGIVNGEKLATPGSIIGNGVSEKLLIQKGFLKENGGFDVNKSEEELDQKMAA